MMIKDTEYDVDETSIVMILLKALHDNYQPVKNTFQYHEIVPSYELLCSAIRNREMELKKSKAWSSNFSDGKNEGKNNMKRSGIQGDKPKDKNQNTDKDTVEGLITENHSYNTGFSENHP